MLLAISNARSKLDMKEISWDELAHSPIYLRRDSEVSGATVSIEEVKSFWGNEVPELVQFQRIIVNVDIFGYVETEQYNIFVLTGSNGISKERK